MMLASQLRTVGQHAIAALLGNLVFTMPSGLARGLRRRFGQGFRPQRGLSREEQFLAGLDLRGKTVFDIGAYVGMYGLFFGRAVGPSGRVICFEPNPRNYRELIANLRLNDLPQVVAWPIGIGGARGKATLLLDARYPARGFVAGARPEPPATVRRLPIEIASVDGLLATGRVPPPDFVKIDVEGLELAVLRGMAATLARYQPALLIEVHYAMPELLPLLHAAGYQVRLVEEERLIDPGDAPLAWGHIACTAVRNADRA